MTSLPGTSSPRHFSKLIVIDASVWISNLLSHDNNHTAAVSWISNHLRSGGRLVAPVMIVLEVAGAVARVSQDQSLTRQALRHLYTWPLIQIVPMDQALVDQAADIAITFGLRGPDAVYVAVANQLSIPLVTLDQEQLTRPAGIITTMMP